MMSAYIWNEICFHLSECYKEGMNESAYENNVILALRVLGWSSFSGDLEIRPSFQIGHSNKITPDIIVKDSEKQKLFVIEIKLPSDPINTRFQKQLFSYMRQLKLDYGLLIGQGIQLFYDGKENKQDDPILIESFKLEPDTEKGEQFVKLFFKDSFSFKALDSFTMDALNRFNREEDFRMLKKMISSAEYKDKLKSLLRQELLNDYDSELVDSALESIQIEISVPAQKKNVMPSNTKPQEKTNSAASNREYLPIDLNPSDEKEFLNGLISKRIAYITYYYKDGTVETKVWKAPYIKENSSVLGNLRSRRELRGSQWQKEGIEKIYVSLDN